MKLKRILASALATVCVRGQVSTAAAEQVIFVVRHAERADGGSGAPAGGMMGNDPPLSAAGHERAKRLATMLAAADVRHIFTTEYARTKQTAAPLAEASKTTPSVLAAGDAAALLLQLRAAAGNILIVGHSNTVPEVLKQLGVKTPITIADSDYDDLFVVMRPASGEPTFVRLRY